jgi:retron-type reverse transcriptase
MVLGRGFIMKTYKNLYSKIYSMGNLILAWRKARKGKTRRAYVIKFEKNTEKNLLQLHYELKDKTYRPLSLKTFILRDPKTRKISVANFRDRIIHHALIRVIGPIFEKIFIYDSCANQKGKGNLFAIKRLEKSIRKVSKNGTIEKNIFHDNNYVKGFCFKADIRHYFQEVDHKILLSIIKKRIRDEEVIWLIVSILRNGSSHNKGMPLGNLTSQFFANVYLNELDYFIKHVLHAKFYIRYVDDFIILHNQKNQLLKWGKAIDKFLQDNLKLDLHKQKTRVFPISNGIDFVGFKIFYYFKLVRRRNAKGITKKIKDFEENVTTFKNLSDSYQGWRAYAIWADSYKLRKNLKQRIITAVLKKA